MAGQGRAAPWDPRPPGLDEPRRPGVVPFPATSAETVPNSSHQWPQLAEAAPRCPSPALPPHRSTPDRGRGRDGDAEAGAGGAATPARCRRLFPRSHPEHRRGIAEQSTKREALGPSATRRRGRGSGRGHRRPRGLCPSILARRRGRLTCSLAGLPRPPAQRRRSGGPAAEGPRSGQHRAPGTGTPLPQHPLTHLGADLGRGAGEVGAVVLEAGGALRREEPLLHADGTGEGLHLPIAQRRQRLARASVSPGGGRHHCTPNRRPLGGGVAELPTWWGAPAGTSTASPRNWRRVQPLTPHSS